MNVREADLAMIPSHRSLVASGTLTGRGSVLVGEALSAASAWHGGD